MRHYGCVPCSNGRCETDPMACWAKQGRMIVGCSCPGCGPTPGTGAKMPDSQRPVTTVGMRNFD
jgi:hypothetical protein